MEDQEIINRLKNRDEECFLEVVDSFKKKVLSLCYSYTNDYHEAEDVSQEVFLTLYNSIQGFRGECSISTYIYKIAVSRCLDYKRKRSIKKFLTDFIGLENEKVETPDLDEKNYVRQCIMALPDELKTPIVLYYYTGLSQKEIGDVIGASPKTVEGRIYRAKQKLRAEFEKGGYILCSKNGMI